MKTYCLSYWGRSWGNKYIEMEADNKEDLYNKLCEEYSDVSLHSYNYTYITHILHCNAAGYPVENITVEEAVSPAHFNKDFFYILK